MNTDTLQGWLDGQRRHVLGILDNLDDDALRRPVLPSGWSCLGLVQHLTADVERFWFRAVLSADPGAVAQLDAATDEARDAWQVDADVPAETVLKEYRAEIARADAVIRRTEPTAAPRWWPTSFGDWRLADRDEVMLHVITETACHAGHLDAARELIDGRQWLVLDG